MVPLETEQLARRVAARSGKTLEDVLKGGVEMEAWIAGVPFTADAATSKRINLVGARAIAHRIANRPLLDPRPPRDILDQAWGAPDDRRR